MLPGRFVQGYAVSIGYDYAYLYHNNQPIESVWSSDEQVLREKLSHLVDEYVSDWHYDYQETHPDPHVEIMYARIAEKDERYP